MRMLVAGINLELLEHCATQRSARKHALYSQLDDTLRRSVNQFAECYGLQAARKCGVRVINLVLHLVACDRHFLGIDDDDVVTSINMRSVFRLVLTTQTAGNFCRHATQGLPFGIQKQPVVFNILRFRNKGLHLLSPKEHCLQGARILPKQL